MTKEVKAFAKQYVKIYAYKNFLLDNERFGMLDITREVNKVVELSDNEMWDLDDYIRNEITKMI